MRTLETLKIPLRVPRGTTTDEKQFLILQPLCVSIYSHVFRGQSAARTGVCLNTWTPPWIDKYWKKNRSLNSATVPDLTWTNHKVDVAHIFRALYQVRGYRSRLTVWCIDHSGHYCDASSQSSIVCSKTFCGCSSTPLVHSTPQGKSYFRNWLVQFIFVLHTEHP